MAKIKLSHSIGAVQAVARLLQRNPGLAGKLATQADRAYVQDGLAGAIEHLQWLYANETAIRAAMAALARASAGGRLAEGVSPAPGKESAP